MRSSEALGPVFSLEDASLVLTFGFSGAPEALRARFFARPGHFSLELAVFSFELAVFSLELVVFSFELAIFSLEVSAQRALNAYPQAHLVDQKFSKIPQWSLKLGGI